MGDANILRRSMLRVEVAARTFKGEIPPCNLRELARIYTDVFCRLYTFYAVLFDQHKGPLPLDPIKDVPCDPEHEALCRANCSTDRSQNVLREVSNHLPGINALDREVRNRVHGNLASPQLRREVAFMQAELDEIARRFQIPRAEPQPKPALVVQSGVKTPRPAEDPAEEKAPIRKKKRAAPQESAVPST